MSEKVFNHALLNFLNQMIVKDGKVHIDSVFRFEQNPEGLPAFL